MQLCCVESCKPCSTVLQWHPMHLNSPAVTTACAARPCRIPALSWEARAMTSGHFHNRLFNCSRRLSAPAAYMLPGML